ncbi:MAG: VWA domain-containing protein [Planctomycetes bacterium]|nr:VWA domain-containing protein [Planctomycetota bacterium]
MQYFPFEFTRPLWLLAAIPAFAWLVFIARHSLAGQSRGWSRFSLGLRAFIVGILILGLADTKLSLIGRGLTVFFLVDRSASVPSSRTDRILQDLVDRTAHLDRDERAGLIVYGRDAGIERAAAPKIEVAHIESVIDRDATNTAGALQLAQAALSGPDVTGGKRVVVVSDGNANVGDEILAAKNLATSGIVVDVWPIDFSYTEEILLDHLGVPAEVHPEEPYVVSVVVHSEVATPARVQLYENDQRIAEREVQLEPGKMRLEFPVVHEEAGRYRYEARLFTPTDSSVDTLVKNNVAYGTTVIRGESRVLFVGVAAEHQPLIDALRGSRIALEIVPPAEVPTDPEEYFFYDCIILANVAAYQLGVETMRLIHGVVKNLGVGLIMVGGPDAFGAGGYRGSPIENLLPVEMEVKQRKTIPNGALVMILHTCEFPDGNMWAKRIAIRAIEMLTPDDFVGVLFWDGMGSDKWGVPLQPVVDKARIASAVRALQPADMPSFEPSMRLALQALQQANAVQRHAIVISDGDPTAPTGPTVQGYIDAKISVTTVCIMPHGNESADTARMKKLAKDTGGRYYFVSNPEELPGIFVREALHVRRNLINEETFVPAISMETAPLRGLVEGGFPPLHGYVITTPKPTAEIALVSLEPHHDPILAHWRYGLARTAAFTSDSGGRWASDWTGWPGFEPFWAQLVRYVSKRGSGELFRVERTIEGDRGRIIVDAIDAEGSYVDSLQIRGRLLDPKMSEQELTLQQVGPGRYEADFDARNAGSYLLSLEYEDGVKGHHQTGVNVSYSPEYRHLFSQRERLEELAAATGGRVLGPDDDPFDRDVPVSRERTAVWDLLLQIALVLFFVDVFCRRVVLSLDPARKAIAWARGRRGPRRTESTETMSALLGRQKSVRGETERRRKRVAVPRETETTPQPSAPKRPKPTPPAEPAPEKPQSFTDRLLEAKRKAQKELDEDG